MTRAMTEVLRIGSAPNRLLRALLLGCLVVIELVTDATRLLFVYPFGVDLEIPLRAAERWQAGSAPYLASAFASPPGATQPFLYPPFVLPPLTLLLDLPRTAVTVAWCGVCLASALYICRRLRLPGAFWPIVVFWPPTLEAVIGGNVQLPLVAIFCATFWTLDGSRATRPTPRDLDAPIPISLGLLTAVSTSIKVSQPHTWLGLLRRRPRPALAGAAIVVAVVALSVPITGIDLWFQWLDQIKRATDPAWELGGIAIGRLGNPVIGGVVSILGIALILIGLPKVNYGEWVGVIAVATASSLHTFGTLFLLPAMLAIRAEIALVAAIAIGTTSYEGMWAGISVTALAMVAGLFTPAVLERGPLKQSHDAEIAPRPRPVMTD